MNDKPRPRGLREWCRLFFSGLCMGAADLVPGVSGGTMALVLGVYENFIRSLCTLRWKNLFRGIAWQFLLALGLGMAVAIFTLAPFFHYLLNEPIYRNYLYAFFMGLVLASSYYCGRRIKKWPTQVFGFFGFGILSAAIVTIPPILFSLSISGPQTFFGQLIWMFGCGLMAVCAMLLPGISGSYVLTIVNAYPVIIEALANLSSGVMNFVFPLESFLIILSLGCGIALGALMFSHLIRWMLSHHHDTTLSCMVGFMIGALPAIWPFAGLSSGELFISTLWMMTGAFVIITVEKVSNLMRQKQDLQMS